ncbi:hypothetical protein [Paenibacillus sp. CR_12]|uniref:hypothetical protein n=1 Tax=Paenibacillus sp. CR_12 TaxID=3055793 RepID=UPI0035C159AE
MKKWLKGSICIILRSAILLTGCSAGDKANHIGNENEEETKNFNTSGYQIVGDKITLTMMGAKAAIQTRTARMMKFRYPVRNTGRLPERAAASIRLAWP